MIMIRSHSKFGVDSCQACVCHLCGIQLYQYVGPTIVYRDTAVDWNYFEVYYFVVAR